MGNFDKRLVVAATVSGVTGLLLGGFIGIAIGARGSRGAQPPVTAPTTTLTAPPPAPPPPPPPPKIPVAVPVAATKPPAREIGTSPYRLHSMTVRRWDGDAWRVRASLMVTLLREVPQGTRIGTKMSCYVDGVVFVSSGLIGPPGGGLVAVGETGATYGDEFFHAPFKGTPQRCELMLYAQMPGAPADVIDHDAGRICVIPDGKTDKVTGAPCPVMVEAPLP